MRVECLAQERNTLPLPGLKPRSLDRESSALTIRPLRLPYPDQGEWKMVQVIRGKLSMVKFN